MKYCKNCGNPLKETDAFCTKCGNAINVPNGTTTPNNSSQKSGNKKTPTWLIVVIVLFVVFIVFPIIIGLGSDSSSEEPKSVETNQNKVTPTPTPTPESTPTPKPTPVPRDLVLEEGYNAYLDDYGYAYYIEGYVNNPTNRDYRYVQITFTSYDSEGNTLGTCLDNNSGLEKGGRWKFKAMCLENAKDIASVKFQKITKY